MMFGLVCESRTEKFVIKEYNIYNLCNIYIYIYLVYDV